MFDLALHWENRDAPLCLSLRHIFLNPRIFSLFFSQAARRRQTEMAGPLTLLLKMGEKPIQCSVNHSVHLLRLSVATASCKARFRGHY